MTKEPKVHRDGQLSCLGGANEGFSPLLIGKNQLARAVNCSLRGGFPETRPGWREHTLAWPNEEWADWADTHTFEGAGVHDPNGSDATIVFSVSGRIFTMKLDAFAPQEIFSKRATTLTAGFISPPVGSTITFTVADPTAIFIGYPIVVSDGFYLVTAVVSNSVTARNYNAVPGVNLPSGSALYFADPNGSTCDQVWMEQSDNWLVIQNGIDRALLFDGSSMRRSIQGGSKPEVPVGKQMAFYDSIGRLVVAVNDRELAIGDIATSTTETINFTEETFLTEGGRFAVPRKYGPVTSLINIASLDTTLGRGPLLVGTRKGILALNLPVTRTLWKEIQTPIQSTAMINYGPRGQNSTINVNGDVFFRSTDGMRSFIMARREFGTWGNVPVSTEVQPILSKDAQGLLRFGSAALFDNRLLMTTGCRRISPRGAYHRGLVALDFHLISGMGQKSPPAYDGLWSGLDIYQMLRVETPEKDRLLIFTKESDGLGLWELESDRQFDNQCARPQCHMLTRSFTGRDETELKEIVAVEIWVDNIVGAVDFDLKYRPDEHPCWISWGTKQICSSLGTQSDDDDCTMASGTSPGYKTRMAFGKPPLSDLSSQCRPSILGYSFQLRLQWTGRARIKKIMVKFAERDEEPFSPC